MDVKERARHEYFMGIAIAVREKANCLGSRVGAVIVRDNRIISTGYNGTPEGMVNCMDGGCYRCSHREEFKAGQGYDRCICVHAEQNALLAAARFGIEVQGSTVYTTTQPCFGCLKEMLQAKVSGVYYIHEWRPSEDARGEYDMIQKAFPNGVHHFDMVDPKAEWAVSTKRENN